MFSSPTEQTLGEAYITNEFDIEGDILGAMELAEYLLHKEFNLSQRLHLAGLLHRLPSTPYTRIPARYGMPNGTLHSLNRDRQAISYHYDLPSEFYALWLDQRMAYSCAYFQRLEDDLETAQLQKLDYVCKKLRLRGGDRLLDIGCGWGALVLHAASRYGVRALGITLSQPQAELAREHIRQARLDDRCRVEICDYRELDSNSQFDKIVSVGMFEHVGEKLLPQYFKKVWNLLMPGGVFLNHGISYSAIFHRKGPSFIERFVFPDAELVPISTSLHAAETSGFEVVDVESLRKHYTLTLKMWLERLERGVEQARSVVDEITYRIWRLYLAGSAYGFRTGRLNVYQSLMVKSLHGDNSMPLTRTDWYQS
jgi:cyclopropane-fatty-acyl-phospholipid synthase